MPLHTTEEIYKQIIRALPVAERFKLATMMLRDIPGHRVKRRPAVVVPRPAR